MANVVSIDEITDDSVTVTLNLDRVFQTQKIRLPCLLTIEKDACTPRLPSYKRKFATQDDAVKVFNSAQLDGLDASRCGLKGSPTQVERIFPPESGGDRQLFEGDGDTLAEGLYQLLSGRKFV